MPTAQSFRTTALIVGLIALGAGIGAYTARYYQPAPAAQIDGLMWPDPKQIGRFAAVDQDGRPFTLDKLQGKWSFLFFGYTHCPDVCPITLGVLSQLERRLLEEKIDAPVQMVFVSVDPQRDTTTQIRDYVRYFSPGLIGVSGTESEVQSITRQVGIAVLHYDPDPQGNYLVDHSASVFLIDPRGRLLMVFPAPQNADAMLSRFRQVLDFIERADA